MYFYVIVNVRGAVKNFHLESFDITKEISIKPHDCRATRSFLPVLTTLGDPGHC